MPVESLLTVLAVMGAFGVFMIVLAYASYMENRYIGGRPSA